VPTANSIRAACGDESGNALTYDGTSLTGLVGPHGLFQSRASREAEIAALRNQFNVLHSVTLHLKKATRDEASLLLESNLEAAS